MFGALSKLKNTLWMVTLRVIVCVLSLSLILGPSAVQAQSVLNLPIPGTMLNISQPYTPVIMVGMTVNPQNPLQFDFIIDTGDDHLEGNALKQESQKLINYFLSTLTVPENEMWVNLSPYEKDRIVADGLGQTVMGRDMLAQDYLLKQLTASLMYPEEELGTEFWDRIHKKAHAKFGKTAIPTNTFNKVWIVPEKAEVYVDGNRVYVVNSHLKVMLEDDYLSLEHHDKGLDEYAHNNFTEESKEILREVLLPEIEREVNNGKNFANLRQIYHSMILATWYKNNLKQSILGQVYVDQNKTKGVDVEDKNITNAIYEQYIEAFKKGVYNYIKEDVDEGTGEIIPRKYFSGGFDSTNISVDELAAGSPISDNSFLSNRSSSPMVKVETKVKLESISASPIDDTDEFQDFDKQIRNAATAIERAIKNGDHVRFDVLLPKGESYQIDWMPVEFVPRMFTKDIDADVLKEAIQRNDIFEFNSTDSKANRLRSHKIEEELRKLVEELNISEFINTYQKKLMPNLNMFGVVVRSRDLDIETVGDSVELKTFDQEALDNDLLAQLILYENKTYDKEADVEHATIEQRARIYYEMVKTGLMTQERFEKFLKDKRPRMRLEMIKAYEQLLTDEIKGGLSVSLDMLILTLDDFIEENLAQTLESLGNLYVLFIERGIDVDLSIFDEYLAGSIGSKRTAATQALVQSFHAMRERQVLTQEELDVRLNQMNVILKREVEKQLSRFDGSKEVVSNFLKKPPEYLTRLSARAQGYVDRMLNGELHLKELEQKLNTTEDEDYRDVLAAVTHIYRHMIAEGQAKKVAQDVLYRQLTRIDELGYSNFIIANVGKVLVALADKNVTVDLSQLKELTNHINSITRKEAVQYLGKIYAAQIRNKRFTHNNWLAYNFWHDNRLFFETTRINTVFLSHIFQLNHFELFNVQAWFDKTGKQFLDLVDDHTLLSIIYILEHVVPQSSIHVYDLILQGKNDRISKYEQMLAYNEVFETLKYVNEHHRPHFEMKDMFILMDFLSIFTFLGYPNLVREQFDREFYSRNHFYSLLNQRLVDVFHEVNEKNPNDVKFDYYVETFNLATERIKPYLVSAGLKSKDRFTRREAAKRARNVKVVTDHMQDSLIAAMDDKDLDVVQIAANSLKMIGNERAIVNLVNKLLGAPEQIVLYIYDDHGDLVAYTEKDESRGVTFDDFIFQREERVDNPKIKIFTSTIQGIEDRINERREARKLDIQNIKDRRLVEFFEFLKQHGLEKDIVVVGGGVRDAYIGEKLNDIDIAIRIPIDEHEHYELLPTLSQANKKIYDFAVDKLKLLAEALNADVNAFLPPVLEEEAVDFNGINIEYAGPILLMKSDKDKGAVKEVYLKRTIVGDNGWVYSHATGATLLNLALDAEGNLYGRVDALADYEKGYLRIAGHRGNLALGNILRLMILKYQYKLYIFQEDYEIIEQTLQKYKEGKLKFPPDIKKAGAFYTRQLKKVLVRAQDNQMAYDELKKLGILDLLEKNIGLDTDQIALQVGGIELDSSTSASPVVINTPERIVRGLKTILSSFENYYREAQVSGDLTNETIEIFESEIKFRRGIVESILKGGIVDRFFADLAAKQKLSITVSWLQFKPILDEYFERHPEHRFVHPAIEKHIINVINDDKARQAWTKELNRPVANTEPGRYVVETRIAKEFMNEFGIDYPLMLDWGVSTRITTQELQEAIGGQIVAADKQSEPFAQITPRMLAQGITKHPITPFNPNITFREGNVIEDFYQELTGKVNYVREAGLLGYINQLSDLAFDKVILDIFRYARGNPQGLLFHMNFGSMTRTVLFGQQMYHITGSDPRDWKIRHIGYIFNLSGKDRTTQISDEEFYEQEVAFSNNIIGIREELIKIARRKFPDQEDLFDNIGRLRKPLKEELMNYLFGLPVEERINDIQRHIAEDVLTISPWSREQEYHGNFYKDNNIHARREVIWDNVKKKQDVDKILVDFLSQLRELNESLSASPVNQTETAANPGGIDFNPNNMRLEQRGQNMELQFEMYKKNPANIIGVTPVIINITPITNLPITKYF